MKKLLLGVIVFTPFLFVSCDPRSGGAGGGGPIEPPPNTPAKISSISIAPSSSIVLTGMNPSNKVTVSVTATGNPAPNITINGVSGSQYTSPDLFESVAIPVSASNGVGSPAVSTANVAITVHPTFAQIVGADSTSWLLTSITGKPVGGSEPPIEYITPCQKTWVYTFRKDLSNKANKGTCGGGVIPGTFTFDITTMKILDDLSESSIWQDVTFPEGKMVFTCIKSGVVLVRTYQRI